MSQNSLMMMMTKIIFFGTPEFAVNILLHLLEKKVDVVAVVTQLDQPKGRSKTPTPPPIKEAISQYNIPIYQPTRASDLDFASVLEKHNADFFVVAAYGEILKENILDIPKVDCINVHPSLLPLYRGAAPMQRSLMDGVLETGVCIMHMVRKMDAGDVIAVEKIPVGNEVTYGELEESLSMLGAELLVKVLNSFDSFPRKPQDDAKVTYAPKIVKEDLQINWKDFAEKIHNQIRALCPKPGAFCHVDIRGKTKRLKILKSKVVDESCGDEWVVSCGEGFLAILQVQLEGKKIMSVQEFIRGFPDRRVEL